MQEIKIIQLHLLQRQGAKESSIRQCKRDCHTSLADRRS